MLLHREDGEALEEVAQGGCAVSILMSSAPCTLWNTSPAVGIDNLLCSCRSRELVWSNLGMIQESGSCPRQVSEERGNTKPVYASRCSQRTRGKVNPSWLLEWLMEPMKNEISILVYLSLKPELMRSWKTYISHFSSLSWSSSHSTGG